ncbi:DLW-39 family protein [Kineococcus sp. LSe6-4]|uniref:DLW-39 family protein n=1 Tax=Kineococcus halophytocola TaxID=3234027 RepID=A0ABV4H4I9_9ACTN
MKKLLVVGLLAGGVFAWRRRASQKAERELWAQATDTVR